MKTVKFESGLTGSVILPPEKNREDPHYLNGYGIDLGKIPDPWFTKSVLIKWALREPIDLFGSVRFEIPEATVDAIMNSHSFLDKNEPKSWYKLSIGSNPKILMPHSDGFHVAGINIECTRNRSLGGMSAFRTVCIFRDALEEMLAENGRVSPSLIKGVLDYIGDNIKDASLESGRDKAVKILDFVDDQFPPFVPTYSPYASSTIPIKKVRRPIFHEKATFDFISRVRRRIKGSLFVKIGTKKTGMCLAVHKEDAHFRARGGFSPSHKLGFFNPLQGE